MRAFVLGSALALTANSLHAQDYSVQYRQTLLRMETSFNDTWRPRVERAQARSQAASDLLAQLAPVLDHYGIITTDCTEKEVDSDTLRLYQKMSSMADGYRADYNSENRNFQSLQASYKAQSETTAQIMAYTAVMGSQLRMKMYATAFDAVRADLTTAGNLERAACATSRISKTTHDRSAIEVAEAAKKLVAIEVGEVDRNLESYQVTIGFISSLNL